MKAIFLRTLVPQRVLRLLQLLFVTLVGALGSLAAGATTVVPLSLSETVGQADAIVVGTITGHQSRWGDASKRWMQTDYTLAVEDVVYASEQGVPIQHTIVLTYWGGTIGGETQAVADIRQPVDGERVLMMLHSRWAQGGTVAPTVGFNHGLFSVADDAVSGKPVVLDAAGRPLALRSDGQIVRGNVTAAVTAGATAMDLPTFIKWLHANIALIKAAPVAPRPTVDQSDPRLMKVFAKTPAPAGAIAPSSNSIGANPVAPASAPPAEGGAGVPAVGPAKETGPSLPASANDAMTVSTDGMVTPTWSTNHQAHLPIVVNNFPPSFAPWSPEDQYQMAKWNYYASEVFRVYTTPTGTYSWGNGVFDLAGWLTDAQRLSMYGSSWYCGTNCTGLAVTFMRFDGGGWIIEADIALNAAVSWTLDDEWVFMGGPAIGFRQSFIHELGHMHGLNHDFDFLALMNYLQPGNYRYFAFPFMDDAAGIRFEYPGNAVSRTDLAVYLYYENGTCYDGITFYNCVSEATYPSNVVAGASLAVNNYHVENVGTTTISTPTIEWYLTAVRDFNSAYYYLGSSTFSSLSPFTYFTPSAVGRTFTVPANVPAGAYFLAGYIRDDEGPGQASFPFSNNYAFSLNRISVSAATYTVTPSAGTGGTVNPATAQTVSAGATTAFVVTANVGYTRNAAVGGTCPQGSWNSNTWTTGAINASCTVSFSFTIVTATNVALAVNGGVATASSTLAGRSPSVTIDNERAGINYASAGYGGIWKDATPGVFPDWVQIDFNGSKTINRVVVYTAQTNFTAPVEPTDTLTTTLGLTSFIVQGWSNGTWVPLATVTGNNLVKRTVTFSATTTERIRIYVTNAPSESRIAEIEAWTAAASTSYTVTPSAGAGGTVNPATAQTVSAGATTAFVVTANAGYTRNTAVGGTCPQGSWNSNTWTTGAINANCTVSFSFTVATTTNVALGGVATASSTLAGRSPSVTIDNERAGINYASAGYGGIWKDATPGVFPDWVQIDFNGSKTINRVVVYTAQTNFTAPVEPTDTLTTTLGLTSFIVQGWSNGTWVPLATVTGNNLVKRTVTFSATTTERIRIYVTNAPSESRIAEIEAWTAAASTSYTVTPSAGAGGTVNPATAQTVSAGATTAFVVTANAGYTRDTAVGGTCPQGSWNSNTWTTGAINANCTVSFSFTVATTTNVALGGVATASSTLAGRSPSVTIDNERAGINYASAGYGGIWKDATPGVFPDWVQIDFNGSKTINRVVVYTAQTNFTAPVEPTDTLTTTLGLTSFTVQGWSNGTWVPLATVTGNNLVKRTVTFSATATERIRIYVTNAPSESRIAEIEAWTP